MFYQYNSRTDAGYSLCKRRYKTVVFLPKSQVSAAQL